MTALLLVAGAAIFVRRPWSYYMHVAICILLGPLFVFYVAPLLGADTGMSMLIAGVIVVSLTAIFFLPQVRRYFGL
jgi:glucose uptake protein GlcU